MQAGEIYKDIIKKLGEAGIAEALTESRIIMRELAGTDTSELLSHPEKELDEQVCRHIYDCVKRRLMREPLQYILGSWDFMGLNFYISPKVLIPRPDTEILVECALKKLHDGMRILDLCTGSGCIILSLLNYSNDCSGTGVDLSPDALEAAEINAKRILGDEKAESLELVLSNLYDKVEGKYDIIVSNPPYIESNVIDGLEPEVKDYEPMLALDGGLDGLDIIAEIISGAGAHLTGGGSLLFEIGYNQGPAVMELMKKNGYIDIECIKDYAGNDRVVRGIKPVLVHGEKV